MDMIAPPDRAATVQKIETALSAKVVAISSATGEGLGELLEACWRLLNKDSDGQSKSSGNQRW
jgi:Fe2+ transport system protein B